ncbi:MAG: M48 family metalloprotease [Elusimicrobiaceae bacterium]
MDKLILALGLVFLTGCSQISLPDRTDAQLGKKIDESLRRDFKPVSDAESVTYITRIGERVGKHTEQPDRKFEFVILQSDKINAFASPAGTVYITTELLYNMKGDEIALAGVLGHEMGHIIKRHAAEKLLNRAGFRSLLLFWGGDRFFAGALAQTANDLLSVDYSREMEKESDLCAVRYLISMGVNPADADRFLVRLENMPQMSPPSTRFLDDHPNLELRRANVADYIQQIHSSDRRQRTQ